MRLAMNIVCLALLLIALVLNFRSYRRVEESKKFQAQIGLTLTTIGVLLLGVITISNLT